MIFFAVAAVVVLYQLYAVLGRRVGRQPEDVAEAKIKTPEQAPVEDEPEMAFDEPIARTGLAALRAADPSFETGRFLNNARKAYEMIVSAFTECDRETLEDLVAPKVLAAFETVMKAKEKDKVSETVEFLQPPRGDLENVDVDGAVARIKVRFLSEQRVRSTSKEGEAVDDRRTAEVWTFERSLKSREPNWLLVRVDAAEA